MVREGRRALTQRGGPTKTQGDPTVAAALETAWDAATTRDEDVLTHGFHAYPARMHYAIARSLMRTFATGGQCLLDPFCGSGTTMVEGMVGGLRPVGVDLNPVGLRVGRVKCERRDATARDRFVEALARVAEASLERVRERVPVTAPLDDRQRRFYEPHVLKELAGLQAEIEAIDSAADRQALEVLLSAIVIKFSRQRADTATEQVDKRIGKGVPTRFFERRGQELVERWAALQRACERNGRIHEPRWVEADARQLAKALGSRFRCDLVISSPPYGGTYDYAEHHERRYPWLGVSSKGLWRSEIGARRNLKAGRDTSSRWDDELGAALESIQGTMRPGAWMFLVLGDARFGRQRVPADDQLRRLAKRMDLEVVASASQSRREFERGGASPKADATVREEHLVALRATERTQVQVPGRDHRDHHQTGEQ